MLTEEIIQQYCKDNRLRYALKADYQQEGTRYCIFVELNIFDSALEDLLKLTKKHKYRFAISPIRMDNGVSLEIYLFPDCI